MEELIRKHWQPSHTPIVECKYFQNSPCNEKHEFSLTAHGIELNGLNESGKRESDFSVYIEWRDVLGASMMNHEKALAFPRYKPTENDIIVHGCIPKSMTVKRRRFTRSRSSFRHLYPPTSRPTSSSATSRNDKDADGIERVLVDWIFRFDHELAHKLVPLAVQIIQHAADPRSFSVPSTAHPASPLEAPHQRRKYLVFINPVGGAGKAKETFQRVVQPVLERSQIEMEVVVTERQHHATELVSKIPLEYFDCVVAIGGDGLLSEVLQGLMARADWRKAVRQPLGIVPGGSGNGLSASVLSQSGERLLATNAAYALAKGLPRDLDIASVRNGTGESMFSFLSLEWAFIADVDIESERYRMFGGLRFTISAVAKILGSKKTFHGKLKYLAVDGDGTHAPSVRYHERTDLSGSESMPVLDYYEQSLHPSSGDSAWKELSGSFQLFWAMNVSHAASDACVAPSAVMDDGYMHMVIVHSTSFSRFDMAKVLLALESGNHVDMQNHISVIRTRAFRLEVENTRDLICVDGEVFPGPEVYVEVHRALGRVLCLPNAAQR